MSGKLIALEGLDGAGTTTQTARLVARLIRAGHAAAATREPSDGTIGRFIRQALADRSARALPHGALALLFAADRVDHVANEVAPEVGAGSVVVSDRYVMSSLAYQSTDHDMKWVAEINRLAPRADLTVFVRVSAKTALARVSARGGQPDRFEKLDIQEHVARQYEQALSWMLEDAQACVSVDGERPPDDVEAAIWAAVSPVL